MATSSDTPAVRIAESADMVQAPPAPLVPQAEQPVQIPGLGHFDDTSSYPFHYSDLGCHELPPELVQTLQQSTHESERQHKACHDDKDIHHFNFIGQGVLSKNSTPPAVSLLVSVTGAGAGFPFMDARGETDPHGYAVMRRAMELVDPILYYGPAENLNLRGEQLREAVTGFCKKYYSEHGKWRHDTFHDEEDRPLLDEMDVRGYPNDVLPVNGWFQNPLVFDRYSLLAESCRLSQERQYCQSAWAASRRQAGRQPSALRQVISVDGLDTLLDEGLQVEEALPEVVPQPQNLPKEGASAETLPQEGPQMGTTTTAGSTSGGRKQFDPSWTVDLDRIFGSKCTNWADEVDDDEEPPSRQPSASLINNAPSLDAETDVVSQNEADVGVDDTPKSPSPASVATDESLPAMTMFVDTSSADEDELHDLPPTPPTTPAGYINETITPKYVGHSMFGQVIESMTAEEIEIEDLEIYGDSLPTLAETTNPLQHLHSTDLTEQGESISAYQSPDSETVIEDEDEGRGSYTPPMDPATIFTGPAFSLPIRAKPSLRADGPQSTASEGLKTGPNGPKLDTISLPFLGKRPGSFDVSGKNVPAILQIHGRPNKPQSEDEHLPPPPSTPPRKAHPDAKELDEIESNENMSPIPLDTLSCAVKPLKTSKVKTRRLTNPTAQLRETASDLSLPEGCMEVKGSASIMALKHPDLAVVSPAQMQEQSKIAAETQVKKRQGLPRSQSFPNLELLAAGKSARSNRQRQSSLPDRPKLQSSIFRPMPKPSWRAQIDLLDAIHEEDESLSPKKSLLLGGSGTGVDGLGCSLSKGKVSDKIALVRGSATTESVGRSECQPEAHENAPGGPQEVLHSQLTTDPTRKGSNPASTQGSGPTSSNDSASLKPLRSVRDVKFICTRPETSSRVVAASKLSIPTSLPISKDESTMLTSARGTKAGLNVEPSITNVKPMKKIGKKASKLGKSLKKFFKKGIESFAIMGENII